MEGVTGADLRLQNRTLRFDSSLAIFEVQFCNFVLLVRQIGSTSTYVTFHYESSRQVLKNQEKYVQLQHFRSSRPSLFNHLENGNTSPQRSDGLYVQHNVMPPSGKHCCLGNATMSYFVLLSYVHTWLSTM